MWTCECGCQAIAGTITNCPMCRREREMPKATTGGASNARALPGEPGYIAPETEQELVPEPVPAQDEPEAEGTAETPVVPPVPEAEPVVPPAAPVVPAAPAPVSPKPSPASPVPSPAPDPKAVT